MLKKEEELSPINEKELILELESLKAQEGLCREKIKKLSREEDFKAGIFYADEIHKLKQDRMDIQFQISYNEAKLKNLKAPFGLT